MMGQNQYDNWFTSTNILIGAAVVVVLGFAFAGLFGSQVGVFLAWAVVILVAGLALLGLVLFRNHKRRQAREKFENAKLDRMLSRPLETFGPEEDEASKLAQLYKNESEE